MKYNKKGVSAVIATVLIILITVAAVAIIWAIILPMIRSITDRSTACINSEGQIEIVESEFTKVNTGSDVGGHNFTFQIKRGNEEFVLSDIKVIIEKGDGNSKSFDLIVNTTSPHHTIAPKSITTKDLPGLNEVKVYTVNLTTLNLLPSDVKVVSIVPMVKAREGAKLITCNPSKSIRL
jgi:flagellin-like protein